MTLALVSCLLLPIGGDRRQETPRLVTLFTRLVGLLHKLKSPENQVSKLRGSNAFQAGRAPHPRAPWGRVSYRVGGHYHPPPTPQAGSPEHPGWLWRVERVWGDVLWWSDACDASWGIIERPTGCLDSWSWSMTSLRPRAEYRSHNISSI